MKSVNYPLALPLDFLDEFKQVAKEAGLSTAATIRQSAKLGLPKFREQISSSRVTNVAPLPNEVARKLYAERAEDIGLDPLIHCGPAKGCPVRAWEIWTGPVFGPHPVLFSRKITQGLAIAGL